MPELLEVGTVVRPHGLRGEVVVSLVTNRLERVEPGTRLDTVLADGTETELEIVASRPFQGRHLVYFAGVSTREAAESLRAATLRAEPVEDPDALFVHDLIGAAVEELDGTPRGKVTAVEANPASDLLVLDTGFLVPLRFVVERRGATVVVDAPLGLFE